MSEPNDTGPTRARLSECRLAAARRILAAPNYAATSNTPVRAASSEPSWQSEEQPSPPEMSSAPGEFAAASPVPVESAPWATVVHNDPVTLMNYVVWVFEDYFHMPTARAQDLMMEIHTRGRAVVSRGAREAMETDAHALHVYGLWATIEEEQ